MKSIIEKAKKIISQTYICQEYTLDDYQKFTDKGRNRKPYEEFLNECGKRRGLVMGNYLEIRKRGREGIQCHHDAEYSYDGRTLSKIQENHWYHDGNYLTWATLFEHLIIHLYIEVDFNDRGEDKRKGSLRIMAGFLDHLQQGGWKHVAMSYLHSMYDINFKNIKELLQVVFDHAYKAGFTFDEVQQIFEDICGFEKFEHFAEGLNFGE